MTEITKPKLILLNGPLGSGKSTLAEKYAENHPITLCLDVDNVRSMISHWRERKKESGPISKDIALAMTRVALQSGHDVVVAQILQTNELAEKFSLLAEECKANYYEILLSIPKKEAINRFLERGKSQGHPSGFREGGIIATSGREEKLAEMYENMSSVANNRKQTIVIDSIYGDIDGTYDELLSKLS
ncbi:MAG: AAA family ATPase [Candidatus Saccharibacteria bacterium]